MKMLIAAGASVNSKDIAGDSPLHITTLHGDPSIVELLIDSGASINSTNNNGMTPLHNAALNGHLNTAKLLLARGAVVGSKSEVNTRKRLQPPAHWIMD
eukprot:m.168555 g.168555  ORF g.168555 m.168555 type:complete len:99 (+) comp10355_c0_seq6:879-1175(+)